MNIILNYGLFLIKTFTIFVSIIFSIFIINNIQKRKNKKDNNFKITVLNKKYNNIKNSIILSKMKYHTKTIWNKKNKTSDFKNSKDTKPTLYVLDFKGTLQANEGNYLREEISAILEVAEKNDEVLLRLESAGGVVHGYGFCAYQLYRLRKKSIHLTISVDKIAASGGYMMASVANYIIATPFAIIGSIGVVAQIPNLYKFLKKYDIDVELHTSGNYKRTLTMFGKNTPDKRRKFCEDLHVTHDLFKKFVYKMRPCLDIKDVSTGEYWFGSLALDKKLIDCINTSDDFLMSKRKNFILIHIQYIPKKNIMNNFINNFINKIIYFVFTTCNQKNI